MKNKENIGHRKSYLPILSEYQSAMTRAGSESSLYADCIDTV